MLTKLAWVFGIVFAGVGVLGFVPGITSDGYLLGIFMVDPIHNVIHLLSGLLAIGAAWTGSYIRMYFKVFGVVYALVTVVGFVQGDNVLGLIDTNMADHVLHLILAAALLYVGFGMKDDSEAPMGSAPVNPAM